MRYVLWMSFIIQPRTLQLINCMENSMKCWWYIYESIHGKYLLYFELYSMQHNRCSALVVILINTAISYCWKLTYFSFNDWRSINAYHLFTVTPWIHRIWYMYTTPPLSYVTRSLILPYDVSIKTLQTNVPYRAPNHGAVHFTCVVPR